MFLLAKDAFLVGGLESLPDPKLSGAVKLGSLAVQDLERRLCTVGLGLYLGGFRCLIRSNTGLLSKPMSLLYQDYWVDSEPNGFYDFRINLVKTRRSFWSDWQVKFDWEGNSPFPPLPLGHAHPLLEWGLNWCIATASGAQQIVIHSAVIERHGLALVLPGDPGSGKSTLCAGLALSGWRLLSDELTIVDQENGEVKAVPRPISLKNSSIGILQSNFPLIDMTEPVVATHKGAIAYVRPPTSAVMLANQTAPIGFVVFPKFKAGVELGYEPLSRASALTELMEHTFNLGLLGSSGFEALAHAIANATCYAVEYGDLTSIRQWVDQTCIPPPA